MKKLVLVFMLALGLGCGWPAIGLAGDVGYRFRDKKLEFEKIPGPPSSSVVAADALLARPAGLALTIAGTAVFLVTLPMSYGSGSTADAAWGLVGRPAGWTFVRPMGRGAPEYEERGIFRP
ncbi:MAG: hypothetical protein ACOZFS_01360 [Thermodesulfobacteriota bacterium]